MTTLSNRASNQSSGRFGMFAGVFTPNVLTILGIILFLRVGWVVGQTGLYGALAIVVLANLISLLTGLSLSSIATSMRVRAGGNYYLISRTLGLEIGGAIGIPLFLSQAISIAFYIIGFTTALYTLEAVQGFDPRLVSTAIALLFGVISYIGADFALKIQYFILAVLIASLVSFFGGGWNDFQPVLTEFNLTEGISFWAVFAVFFPAVTGIEVGVSLSGDLKNPSRDIPLGTILSIVVTAFIYILAVIWFATHLPAETLLTENMAMQSVALWPGLILAGVWASTLSSALGSILAAPRTLQAIALDDVVPRFFADQMGSRTEPRVAVIFSTIIAVSIIWLGGLDFVATIITMFFLNTYGMVNLVAGIEKLVGNPSFRPRFRIHWSISILGAIGCYGVMLLINAPATLIALVISYGIFFVLQRRQVRRRWGDVRSGILFTIARGILLALKNMDLQARNWRPNLIVFTGQPHNREALVKLSSWLTVGRGIVTFFQLIIGKPDDLIKKGYKETAKKNIKKYIQDHDLQAFAEAEIVPNFPDGALTVAQAHGIGGLEPNCVVMGWSETVGGQIMQMNLMRRLDWLHKSIFLLHTDAEKGYGVCKRIQIVIQDVTENVDLMLLLAYLIRQHHQWHDAEISVLQVVERKADIKAVQGRLIALIDQARVPAIPMVIPEERENEPLSRAIMRSQVKADLTLMGIKVPDEGDEAEYSEYLNQTVKEIGTVLMVHSGYEGENGLLQDQSA